MNVLLVTTSYPLNAVSSSGIFVKRLKRALGELCRVTVVCPDDTVTSGKVAGVCRSRYGPKNWQSLAHQPGGIPAAIRRDARYLLLVPFLLLSMQVSIIRRLSDHDVIFANWAINALISWLPALLFRKTLITVFRGEDVRNLDKGLQVLIVRFALQVSDKVILVSGDMEKSLIRRFPRYRNKFQVIHNGVENRLLNSQIAARNTYKNGQVEILAVASLIPRKDIVTLLNAVSILNSKKNIRGNITVSIVGGGELLSVLKSRCDELNISDVVRFFGEIAPENVEEMYSHAQLFVLPSLFEGRPNVVVEAMAAGCCVIVSDIDGSSELIENNTNGLVFPVGDEHALADQLVSVIDDPAKRSVLGHAAREYVIHHQLSWEGCASSYYHVFDELTAA